MPALESTKLNPAQMMILESFAGSADADETEELMDLLRDFHASRLEREMERLDADGTLDTARLQTLRSRHLRTPYRRTAP